MWPILQKHWLLEVVPDRSQIRHVTHRTQNFNETCAGGLGLHNWGVIRQKRREFRLWI